jgi:xanthine dehydrogenase iron-sulfur cluster and FAD-binding subunit A
MGLSWFDMFIVGVSLAVLVGTNVLTVIKLSEANRRLHNMERLLVNEDWDRWD